MKIEISLEELRDSYDWKEAFGYAGEPGTHAGEQQARRVSATGKDLGAERFTRTDVSKVLAAVNGEQDKEEWVGLFRLKDDRYLGVRAGCDYTGWD